MILYSLLYAYIVHYCVHTAAASIPQTSENRRYKIVEPRHRVGTSVRPSVRRYRVVFIILYYSYHRLREAHFAMIYVCAVCTRRLQRQVATYEILLCAERCITHMI
jgi:hypothetical protein